MSKSLKHIADLRQRSEKVLLRNRKSCRVTTQTKGSCKAEKRERSYDNKSVRYCIKIHNYTDSIINNRVSEQTKHFTMESLILAQDER
jgi:hypothetical protein